MQTKSDTVLPPVLRPQSPQPSSAARTAATAKSLPQWRCRDEQRRAMVEHIAYSRAKRRGFTPGHELQDWLDAEAEVERWLEGEHYSGD